MKQIVSFTVNHRGPLPLRELHSTDEPIVWRDPGGSRACIRPISDTDIICDFFWKQIVFLTVNHRGPLPLREFHSTDETIVWRDPGGS